MSSLNIQLQGRSGTLKNREKKEYEQKETYPINMGKIKKKLEFDIELEKNNNRKEEEN